ncbi:hypothetical protein [Paraflavitalea sp. CAU 1676]|uniref:hypothetical protein n=1 Tax=Paraflavitalea sp. CAU 1676 TaxID=3032598 RepID=UPI0023DBEB4F|nr:hypothetical protein [Paraflavitalea sp. CAU 1676]MDF2187895.1 hypothetical protein [Paraflavitalea sp. CAU 1676]
MKKQSILLLVFLAFVSGSYCQSFEVNTLRNCQGEMRTFTFQSQVKIIWKCVAKWTTLREQRILNFSPEYKLDSAYFDNQILKIRKALPVNFFKDPTKVSFFWHNNVPDEKAIWFIELFMQKDSKGKYIVYAAVKVEFDGTDAKVDRQRSDPKIKALTFILDRNELDELGKKLKASPEAL